MVKGLSISLLCTHRDQLTEGIVELERLSLEHVSNVGHIILYIPYMMGGQSRAVHTKWRRSKSCSDMYTIGSIVAMCSFSPSSRFILKAIYITYETNERIYTNTSSLIVFASLVDAAELLKQITHCLVWVPEILQSVTPKYHATQAHAQATGAQ